MTIKENIEQILKKNFSPSFLEVVDESDKHKGHKGNPGGGETHFFIKMVSSHFKGKTKLARHRMVFEALSSIDVHALSMKLLSDKEIK